MTIKQSVLNLLHKTTTGPMTRMEIRQHLSDLDADAKQINNAIDNLLAKGLLEKGWPLYQNNANVLTYQITDHGVQALESADATPHPDNDPDMPVYVGLELDEEQPHPIGYTVLDNTDPAEVALAQLIDLYRAGKQPKPSIENPLRKLEILQLLLDSALVNPSFKPELEQLASYIERTEIVKLEAAA